MFLTTQIFLIVVVSIATNLFELHTVDQENFVVKKVTWNKSSTRFDFVKAESIVCTSTKELC